MDQMFPTETAGDGLVRPPYRRAHDGQGRAVSTRRVSCGICGFPGVDTNKHDSGGGSLAGDGAGGIITQQGSGADANQAYNTGGGCPLCMSKNYIGRKMNADDFVSRPSDILL